MPESISVIYCFPRSGGTLLNQCLLCAPTTVVLSEVNPAGSVVEPETQAADWFGLATPTETASIKDVSYLEKIDFIQQRTRHAGRKLCLRDWSGLNFLPGAVRWAGEPSLQLEQRLYLQKGGYRLREIVMLRRSQAVYQSLRSHIPEFASFPLPAFRQAYRAFLGQIAGVRRFRLEQLVQDKETVIREVCRELQLDYAADFESRFHLNQNVTGNTTLAQRPESATWTSIRSRSDSPDGKACGTDPAAREIFAELDHQAGYDIAQQ